MFVVGPAMGRQTLWRLLWQLSELTPIVLSSAGAREGSKFQGRLAPGNFESGDTVWHLLLAQQWGSRSVDLSVGPEMGR
jgi:hypothetical protein